MIKYGLLIGFISIASVLYSQNTIERAKIENGDTIIVKDLPSVVVVARKKFKTKKAEKKYDRLYYKVKKVYPLAKLAGQKLREYAAHIDTLKTDRAKRKFYKRVEEELKEEYEADLKKLTRSEGRILIKLIDRETSDTSYELVKNLRGTFTAFFWQGLAKMFGQDLKSQYDPNGEDKLIEEIVLRIEAGY